MMLVACGGKSTPSATTTTTTTDQALVGISGTVLNANFGCGGYTDIPRGASVVVRNEANVVIGDATLVLYADAYPRPGYDRGVCAMKFSLAVPSAAFYRFEIDRFQWTVPKAQLVAANGLVVLPVEIAAGVARAAPPTGP